MPTAGPALERKGDVASYLTALEPRSVFFVDEIHRLPAALEETFYPAMEDRKLPITVGQGAGARGRDARPARVHAHRRHHAHGPAHDAAAGPLRGHAPAGALRARRPRPDRAPLRRDPRRRHRRRPARRRSPRARAEPRVWRTGCSSACATSPRCAARARIDARVAARGARPARGRRGRARPARPRDPAHHLREVRRRPGGPVDAGVAVGEEPDTIEDVYEPYLLQQGFMMRTPRGRVATDAAFAHLGSRRRATAPSACSDLDFAVAYH